MPAGSFPKAQPESPPRIWRAFRLAGGSRQRAAGRGRRPGRRVPQSLTAGPASGHCRRRLGHRERRGTL